MSKDRKAFGTTTVEEAIGAKPFSSFASLVANRKRSVRNCENEMKRRVGVWRERRAHGTNEDHR